MGDAIFSGDPSFAVVSGSSRTPCQLQVRTHSQRVSVDYRTHFQGTRSLLPGMALLLCGMIASLVSHVSHMHQEHYVCLRSSLVILTNPWRACAVRVRIVGLSVCVCVNTCSGTTGYEAAY